MSRRAADCAFLALWIVALAAVILSFGRLAKGAPAPPPPRVTAELVGGATWRLEWGTIWQGVTHFGTDGTYYSAPDETGRQVYVGTWRIEEGGILVLAEQRFDPATGEVSQWPQRFEIPLSATRYPRLDGVTAGGTRVVMSDPRR